MPTFSSPQCSRPQNAICHIGASKVKRRSIQPGDLHGLVSTNGRGIVTNLGVGSLGTQNVMDARFLVRVAPLGMGVCTIRARVRILKMTRGSG
jgi:hypothetical protein